eukprot:Pgem_evm1s13127
MSNSPSAATPPPTPPNKTTQKNGLSLEEQKIANKKRNRQPANSVSELKKSISKNSESKKCANCETSDSKSWRIGKFTKKSLCSPCGLYENAHKGDQRPLKLANRKKQQRSRIDSPMDGNKDI